MYFDKNVWKEEIMSKFRTLAIFLYNSVKIKNFLELS